MKKVKFTSTKLKECDILDYVHPDLWHTVFASQCMLSHVMHRNVICEYGLRGVLVDRVINTLRESVMYAFQCKRS